MTERVARARGVMRSLRWPDLQLLVLLPAAYQAVFPRLGPPSWDWFHFFVGVAVMLLPALAYINLVWLGIELWSREDLGRAAAFFLLCIAIVVVDRTWAREKGLRHMDEARRVGARHLRCDPANPVYSDWSGAGALIYCQRTLSDGRLEWIQGYVSNGPFPWSAWNVDERPWGA